MWLYIVRIVDIEWLRSVTHNTMALETEKELHF